MIIVFVHAKFRAITRIKKDADLHSVIRPVSHRPAVLIPIPLGNSDSALADSGEESTEGDNVEFVPKCSSSELHLRIN